MSECRICYNAVKDTLVAPCRCSGSIKYIHQSCLVQWVREKYPKEFARLLKNQKLNDSQIQCELCKYEYKTNTTYLNLLQICKKIKGSNLTLSVLINIPVIVFLIYKCNYMLRHLFLFIYSQTLGTNKHLLVSQKISWFFKVFLGLCIRLLPISLVGTVLPLFIHSTAKLMKQLWMEFKHVRFENLL
jgi:hypothetical protein